MERGRKIPAGANIGNNERGLKRLLLSMLNVSGILDPFGSKGPLPV
jgi:hypothetical protein